MFMTLKVKLYKGSTKMYVIRSDQIGNLDSNFADSVSIFVDRYYLSINGKTRDRGIKSFRFGGFYYDR